MKKIILAMLALIASASFSASALEISNYGELVELVNTMKLQCPMDIGGGMAFDDVEIIKDNVFFYMTMPLSDDQIRALEGYKSQLALQMLEGVRQNPDTLEFFNGCKKCHVNFTLVMYSANHTAQIRFFYNWQDL